MKSLSQTYTISASLSDVWDALVNPKTIDAWGGGPHATMNDQMGTQFKLWDGDIYGKNIEVVHQKLLRQEWFSGDWDEPSIVTFTLTHKDKQTIVHLDHTHIPDTEFTGIRDGWKEYYLIPIKELLENKKTI